MSRNSLPKSRQAVDRITNIVYNKVTGKPFKAVSLKLNTKNNRPKFGRPSGDYFFMSFTISQIIKRIKRVILLYIKLLNIAIQN